MDYFFKFTAFILPFSITVQPPLTYTEYLYHVDKKMGGIPDHSALVCVDME